MTPGTGTEALIDHATVIPGVRSTDPPAIGARTDVDPMVTTGVTVNERTVVDGTAVVAHSSRVGVMMVHEVAAARVGAMTGPLTDVRARIVAAMHGPEARSVTVDVDGRPTLAVGHAMTVAAAVIDVTIDGVTSGTIRRQDVTGSNAVPGPGTDRPRRNVRLATRESNRHCRRRSPARNSIGRCGGRCAR